MNDMSVTIVPKSDQINADDLLAEPRTITIAAVRITPGTEQPVSIEIEGDRKVFRPCKSMCRVMVAAWGKDANLYAGRSMTLYRDAAVKWGSLEVGGIRISHMTHMDRQLVIALTATKGNKRPHVVQPLKVQPPVQIKPAADAARDWTDKFVGLLLLVPTLADLEGLLINPAKQRRRDDLATKRPELFNEVVAAIDAARERLRPAPEPTPEPPAGDLDDEVPF